jgi:hypothetical protein
MSTWLTVVVAASVAATVAAFVATRAANRRLYDQLTSLRPSARTRTGAAVLTRRRATDVAPTRRRATRRLSTGGATWANRDAVPSATRLRGATASESTAAYKAAPMPAASRELSAPARGELIDRPSRQPGPRRTAPLFAPHAKRAVAGRAAMHVHTATNTFIHPLTDTSTSWRVAADDTADIIVRDLAVEVLVGRNGDVWTVRTAGPIMPDVVLDGVPLTRVAMPWAPQRRLRIGAVDLSLEGIQGAIPSLDQPAERTHARLASKFAARANVHALALAEGPPQEAATLATAALACFDPRLLDPARAASLAALNVSLALRRHHIDQTVQRRVAVVGFDADGELRGAANFAVTVWAVTVDGPVNLGGVGIGGVTHALDVVALEFPQTAVLSRNRGVLLLAAGPGVPLVPRRLKGLTPLNATPKLVVEAVAGGSNATRPVAAAAAAAVPPATAGAR